jgi:hypothetical protein
MSVRESKLRTALATGALLIALFQCWYVYLPEDRAVHFHYCRLNAHLDCFKSLSMHGADMVPFGVPVFPALAASYLWMVALLGFAFTADEPRRTAWGAWAAIGAFPATGLSVYVLLDDILVAKVTSLSTLVLLGVGLALCVIGVVRGIAVAQLRSGARGAAGFAALALVAGFLMQGAGSTALATRAIEVERASAPAQLRWSRFALALPRVGAAHIGRETAPRELLLIVDPAQDSSRAAMRAVAALAPTIGSDVSIYLYAPDDPRLLQAFLDGKLLEFLEKPETFPQRASDDPGLPPGFERQAKALRKLGVDTYPTAWSRSGKTSGEIDLPRTIASLRQQ